MFITAADFGDIPYNLPGITKAGAVDTFTQFITDMEDEWLRKLVGNLFYDAMVAGVGALPATWTATKVYVINDLAVYQSKVWKALAAGVLPAPIVGVNWALNPDPLVDRWLLLRDGKSYKIASIPSCPTFNWVGMRRMIQPLIYSLWLRITTRSNTGQGIVVSANENSELVSPGYEIVKAWRIYTRVASKAFGFSRLQILSVENSFYGYLVANATNFNDVVTDGSYIDFLTYIQNQFNSPGRMNEFDI